MNRHLFIINPKAGGKDKSSFIIKKIRSIENDLSLNHKFYIEITEYEGHATKIAGEYAIKYNDLRIYSCGGDGTLNEILQGIKNHLDKVSLSVIPIGTGNDFIKSIYVNYDIKKIDVTDFILGDIDRIDILKINDYLSLNIASIGFDAKVSNYANHYKKYSISHKKVYYLSIFRTLIGKLSQKLTIEFGNQKIEEDILLCLMANGKYYGGGIMPTPNADLKDGKLELLAIKKISKIKFISLLNDFISGHAADHKNIVHYKSVKKVKIYSDSDFLVNLDGEIKKARELNVEVLKNKIKFIMPRKDRL